MYRIDANFIKLSDVRLDKIAEGLIGVYVLYSGHSRSNPTYIGEGIILDRFYAHLHNKEMYLTKPISGVMAIIGDKTRKYWKERAQIVEWALLNIALETNRFPARNKKPGNNKIVEKYIEKYNKIKIYCYGIDPFCATGRLKISDNKIIDIDKNGITIPWNRHSPNRGRRY